MFSDSWDNEMFDAYNGEDYPGEYIDLAREMNLFIKTADTDWIEWYINN